MRYFVLVYKINFNFVNSCEKRHQSLSSINMNNKVWQIFKYLSLFYTVGFWVYLYVDDYLLIQRNGLSVLLFAYLCLLYLLYFVYFALYYWAIVLIGKFAYKLFIKKHDS